MIAVPCAFIRASTANSRSISRDSSAAVGSSRMSSRQRLRSALAMATSWRSAKLRRSTRASGSGAKIELRQTLARLGAHRVAVDQRQAETEHAPHRRIAERQVLGDRQGGDEAQLLRNGGDAGGDRVVRTVEMARPAFDRDLARSGRCTPPRMRTSVDLPAPFSPTSAWISPGITSKSTLSSARVAPNCLEMPRALAAGVAMLRRPCGRS